MINSLWNSKLVCSSREYPRRNLHSHFRAFQAEIWNWNSSAESLEWQTDDENYSMTKKLSWFSTVSSEKSIFQFSSSNYQACSNLKIYFNDFHISFNTSLKSDKIYSAFFIFYIIKKLFMFIFRFNLKYLADSRRREERKTRKNESEHEKWTRRNFNFICATLSIWIFSHFFFFDAFFSAWISKLMRISEKSAQICD